MTPRARAAALPAVALAAVLVVAGCATGVPGSPVPGDGVVAGDVDTSVLQGASDDPVDDLAAATLIDVQDYWEQEFDEAFDQPWEDISGGLHSVDTSDPDAPPPPCVPEALQVEGNAYYCPSADAIAWDRAALLPVLRERHGDTAVVVVLAHEVGHAVHHRLGVDEEAREASPGRYPTILTEAMADCFAGAFVRHVVDGDAEHLRIDPPQLDSALGALVTFRDPVGTTPEDDAAHGNAFDRVSSFQDGYEQGPALCADFSVDNRAFTQTAFSESDAATGGNLPFDDLVGAITPNLDEYFTGVVGDQGGQWSAPAAATADEVPDCAEAQGPVGYCPDTDEVTVDGTGVLPELHGEIGDYATGSLVASRYGLAALDDLDRPVEGEEAGRTALCLAGTYTGALLTAGVGRFGLSPGDLDEAVQVLLEDDYASRDARGTGTASGFDRVTAFRTGTLEGVDACLA